jgi:hypothetical protein
VKGIEEIINGDFLPCLQRKGLPSLPGILLFMGGGFLEYRPTS